MTGQQLKDAIKARGYTLKQFAEILAVAYPTLRLALSGQQPLTEPLKRHIILALKARNTLHPDAGYIPAGGTTVIPVTLPLSLPTEILSAIDKNAESEGISPDEYIESLCVQFAKQVARGIIQARIISGE